jgi:tetratricopeptide (TPR) repeat protein
LGRFAEAAVRESVAILKESLGERHPEYAKALDHLGRIYQASNQPQRAEAVLKESCTILAETLGEKHPDYAESLAHLGQLYLALRQPDRGNPLLEQAGAILDEALSGGPVAATPQGGPTRR